MQNQSQTAHMLAGIAAANVAVGCRDDEVIVGPKVGSGRAGLGAVDAPSASRGTWGPV
jgi:hypothetical protein